MDYFSTLPPMIRPHVLDADARDLTAFAFDDEGRFRVMPAAQWAGTTQGERSALCAKHAMYCLPTVELVERLQAIIAGRTAIEIGAGNGVLAAALGIRATDNHMQSMPRYQRAYATLNQPTVRYGAHVDRTDAHVAIEKHRPQVVIAAWVTHRYDKRRHDAGGNEIGVVEERVIDSVETYVMVGHTHVHRCKSIWSRPHEIEYPPYVLSRAMSSGHNFIAIWNRDAQNRREVAQ
jgi:hypothetical protein